MLSQKGSVCAVCFEGEGRFFDKFIEYGKENDDLSQAHHIFDALREVDAMGCDKAFVRCPISSGVGLAVYWIIHKISAVQKCKMPANNG